MIEPRLLTDEEAAAYLSLPVTVVGKLTVGRVQLGGKRRFDRRALDVHLDALSGLPSQSTAPASPSRDDDSPDAALERFAERQSHAPRLS